MILTILVIPAVAKRGAGTQPHRSVSWVPARPCGASGMTAYGDIDPWGPPVWRRAARGGRESAGSGAFASTFSCPSSKTASAMLLGFLLVLLVLVCIALGAVILLQRSEGGALGMGGGPSGFMTARGAGDLLTRTTSILAGVFFLLCLLLTVLSGRMHGSGSVADRLKINAINPDALGAIKHTPAPDAAPGAAGAPAAAGGSAANIGVVTPAPGTTFEAPRPEVHTEPAVRPTAAPPTAADNGANRRSSTTLGLQTAPQSTPTFAPLARPFPAAGLPPAPAQSGPPAASGAPAPSGNTQGGT